MSIPRHRSSPTFRAAAYSRPWRFIAAVLFAVSRASLPCIALLVVLGLAPPPLLVRLLLMFTLLPWLAAALLRRALAVDVEVVGDTLIMHRRGPWPGGARLELVADDITHVAAWQLPLPGPGLTIRGRENNRYSLQLGDPGALLQALGQHGARSATVAYGEAREAVGRMRWHHWVARYGLFPLLPTFVFFRLHQWILYGGLLGQYYLHGLEPYLSTLAFHWIMAVIYVVLYASVWRSLAEGAALFVAWAAPAHALATRRWAERAVTTLFYGGIPALMALRFLV